MSEPTAEQKVQKPSWQQKLKLLFEEFGGVAIGVYAVLWVGTLGGLYVAVSNGWKPESAAGQAGTFGAAYVVFRFTLPARIAATAVLTPLIARLLERLGLKKRRI